jgi:3-oxoacyl-[acyl-carrier-protein] synthase II
MSKVIKRAIASTKISIAESGIEMPDAVISGTGLGCIADTERFLTDMIDNDEKFLQPTFFIQSTHNTISSQIAIHLKCHGHNNTFVHGGMSFECALLEALLLFAGNKVESALVGGYDEMTPTYFKILDRIGFWKKDFTSSAELFESKTPGAFAGEGSISVMLANKKNENTYASIDALEMIYQPPDIVASVKSFLNSHGKGVSEIDLVVLGMNGDALGDQIYKSLAEKLFGNNALAWYKHLSGEYFTSSGFGLWLAANCIKHKIVPPFVALNNKSAGKIQNILMVNHYQNKNFSLILFSEC